MTPNNQEHSRSRNGISLTRWAEAAAIIACFVAIIAYIWPRPAPTIMQRGEDKRISDPKGPIGQPTQPQNQPSQPQPPPSSGQTTPDADTKQTDESERVTKPIAPVIYTIPNQSNAPGTSSSSTKKNQPPIPVQLPSKEKLKQANSRMIGGQWLYRSSSIQIGGQTYAWVGRGNPEVILDVEGWDEFTAVAGMEDANGPGVASESSRLDIIVDDEVKSIQVNRGEGQRISIKLTGARELKLETKDGVMLAEPTLVRNGGS